MFVGQYKISQLSNFFSSMLHADVPGGPPQPCPPTGRPTPSRAGLLSSISAGKKLRPVSDDADGSSSSSVNRPPPRASPPENTFLTAIRRGSVLKKVDHAALQKEKEEKKKASSGMFGKILLTLVYDIIVSLMFIAC
jgi:hypothetical protein